jgi:hypothetical protein
MAARTIHTPLHVKNSLYKREEASNTDDTWILTKEVCAVRQEVRQKVKK